VLRDHGYTPKSESFVPCEYVARNLQYLETPQYLRKHLFKMHPDLNNVGLMNPIEAKHHLKADQPSEFREGVALERPTKHGAGSWVDIGLRQQARMNILVLPLTRVTLRLQNFDDPQAPYYEAEAVSKKTPRV
jgi:predicted SPOUT superfamily RNA methylase MTH1